MLVAVVMLFVVGAMAALSIDVVTLYTARSEAQLAADGAALAGARVLANSGMTSDPTGGLTASAQVLATKVATQVAQQNEVGGSAAGVTVNYGGSTPARHRSGAKNRSANFLRAHMGTPAPHGGCVGHRGSLQSFGYEHLG